MVKILYEYGADLTQDGEGLDTVVVRESDGKVRAVDEKGIYPEDVLKYYGATVWVGRDLSRAPPRSL